MRAESSTPANGLDNRTEVDQGRGKPNSAVTSPCRRQRRTQSSSSVAIQGPLFLLFLHPPSSTLQSSLGLGILTSPLHPFCGPLTRLYLTLVDAWLCLSYLSLMGVLCGRACTSFCFCSLLTAQDWKVAPCTEVMQCLFVV